MFNRFKLGRTLDEAYAYGCTLLFEELALAVCTHEGIDRRFNHLDTTSFCLTGEDLPDRDEHALCMTHGYSTDHRPDLKQAVLALMVSQDGGGPCVRKSWAGNTSDTRGFQERAEAMEAALQGIDQRMVPTSGEDLKPTEKISHAMKKQTALSKMTMKSLAESGVRLMKAK
jgi:transposase